MNSTKGTEGLKVRLDAHVLRGIVGKSSLRRYIVGKEKIYLLCINSKLNTTLEVPRCL